MFQVLSFFITSCKILCKKPFQLIFLFFKKITEIKSFECSKSIRSYEKKKYLEPQTLGGGVVCPIVPANQRFILQIVGFQLYLPILAPLAIQYKLDLIQRPKSSTLMELWDFSRPWVHLEHYMSYYVSRNICLFHYQILLFV